MSRDLLYESPIHIFRGHFIDRIQNGAYNFVRCPSCMSLNESIYNHVPRENKKTYTYMGGGKTHFDSYRKISEPDYPTQSANVTTITLHFSDPLTHTLTQDQQNPTNPTTNTAAANQNHESETAEGETA